MQPLEYRDRKATTTQMKYHIQPKKTLFFIWEVHIEGSKNRHNLIKNISHLMEVPIFLNINANTSLEDLLIKISEDKISESDASSHILNLLNKQENRIFKKLYSEYSEISY